MALAQSPMTAEATDAQPFGAICDPTGIRGAQSGPTCGNMPYDSRAPPA